MVFGDLEDQGHRDLLEPDRLRVRTAPSEGLCRLTIGAELGSCEGEAMPDAT